MKMPLVVLAAALAMPAPARAIDTVIKGGRMELRDKGDIVYFTDGVRLTRGPDRLVAREMVTTKSRDRVTAIGDVKLHRDVSEQEKWDGTGEKGYYDTRSGTGYLLRGRRRAHLTQTKIISSTATQKVDIDADRFDFERDPKIAVATGDVFGTTTNPDTGDVFRFWAEKAVYDGNERKVTLTGNPKPKIHQHVADGERTITGQVIIYYIDSQRLVSKDDAEAVFTEEKKEDNP